MTHFIATRAMESFAMSVITRVSPFRAGSSWVGGPVFLTLTMTDGKTCLSPLATFILKLTTSPLILPFENASSYSGILEMGSSRKWERRWAQVWWNHGLGVG